MTRNSKRPTRPRPVWPDILKEPLVLSDFQTDGACVAALDERIAALFAFYGVAPDKADSFRLLAWQLALSLVPGFRVKFGTHAKPDRKGIGGRPPLGIDRVTLVCEVDRIKKLRGYSASSACRTLVQRRGPFKGRKEKSLLTKYYKVHGTVRASPVYLAQAGDLLCAQYPSSTCFTLNELQDTDLASLPSLCASHQTCQFRNSAASVIKRMTDSLPKGAVREPHLRALKELRSMSAQFVRASSKAMRRRHRIPPSKKQISS